MNVFLINSHNLPSPHLCSRFYNEKEKTIFCGLFPCPKRINKNLVKKIERNHIKNSKHSFSIRILRKHLTKILENKACLYAGHEGIENSEAVLIIVLKIKRKSRKLQHFVCSESFRCLTQVHNEFLFHFIISNKKFSLRSVYHDWRTNTASNNILVFCSRVLARWRKNDFFFFPVSRIPLN